MSENINYVKKFVYIKTNYYLCTRKPENKSIMAQSNLNPYEFYEWLKESGIKLLPLAEASGIDRGTLSSLFNRNRNWRGSQRRFTPALVATLNEALPKLAGRLVRAHAYFDVSQAVTKRTGCYDPSCMARLKEEVVPIIDTTTLAEKYLGWSRSKRNNVFVNRTSHVYGNITREDVQRINDTLDALAQTIMQFCIVMPEEGTGEDAHTGAQDGGRAQTPALPYDIDALRAKPVSELTEDELQFLCDLDFQELGIE